MKNMLLNTGGVENCLYAKENSYAGCFVLLNLKVLFSNYTLLQKLDHLVLVLTKIVNQFLLASLPSFKLQSL